MKKILLSISIVFTMIVFGVAQTTTDGLVGYWKFDEGSGTTVGDELGTTNGELVNSVDDTWATGYSGSALDFSKTSGSPAYARFDGKGVTDFDGSFSMMFWLKSEMSPNGDEEYSILSNGVPWLITDGIDGGWYHISLKDGAIRFMLWDQAGNFSSPAGELPVEVVWDANTWYHIAVVRDTESAVLSVYLNGQLISSDTDAMQESLSNNEDFTLGSVATGVQTETVPNNTTASEDGSKFWPSNFLGLLDEVQLYNVALSADAVSGIYDAYMNGGGSGKSVAYVTKQKDLDVAAWPVTNDVVIQTLNADANIDLTVLVCDGDGNDINTGSAVDLGGYDAVVAAETFGSGDAVWTESYPLYLGSFPVPTLYNKMYALRPSRILTSGDGASNEGSGVIMAVDAPDHDIFNGIDVSSGTIPLAKATAHDDGTAGEKCMQYNTGNVVSGTTMLGHPEGATDAVLSFDMLPAGAMIDNIEVPVEVINFAMNQGQLNYKGEDGTGCNLTPEGLTMWRNAVYILAGLEVPESLVEFVATSTQKVATSEIAIYPNPATDQINVNGVEPGSLITVYSASGQAVAYKFVNSNKASFDVSNLQRGVYLLKVERSGKSLVSRFVKR